MDSLKKEIKNYIADGNKIPAKLYLSKDFSLNKIVDKTIDFLDKQIEYYNFLLNNEPTEKWEKDENENIWRLNEYVDKYSIVLSKDKKFQLYKKIIDDYNRAIYTIKYPEKFKELKTAQNYHEWILKNGKES